VICAPFADPGPLLYKVIVQIRAFCGPVFQVMFPVMLVGAEPATLNPTESVALWNWVLPSKLAVRVTIPGGPSGTMAHDAIPFALVKAEHVLPPSWKLMD
jgi:hypothetical protein